MIRDKLLNPNARRDPLRLLLLDLEHIKGPQHIKGPLHLLIAYSDESGQVFRKMAATCSE